MLLYRRNGRSKVLLWVIVAFVLYVAVVIITAAVHLPPNDSIQAAGDPAQIADVAAVREDFHETRWMAWNIVRAVASTIAFGCLAWATFISQVWCRDLLRRSGQRKLS